jgi:hypothetical protein
MKKHFLILLAVVSSMLSFAPEETGTVFIARKKLYTGAMGSIEVFMDGKLMCSLSNNAYSQHFVRSGKHTFTVGWTQKNPNNADAIEVDITPGKEYFMRASKEDRGLKAVVLLQELTSGSWSSVKEDITKTECSQ